jgi:plastocyanin
MVTSQSKSRRVQRAKQRDRLRRIRVASLVALCVVVVAVAMALSSGGESGDTSGKIDVDMFEFGFEGELTAPAGDIRMSVKNSGQLNHNIGIRGGPISPEVLPGGRIRFDLGSLGPGTYELYCDILGHADAGMVAPLVITEAQPSS